MSTKKFGIVLFELANTNFIFLSLPEICLFPDSDEILGINFYESAFQRFFTSTTLQTLHTYHFLQE